MTDQTFAAEICQRCIFDGKRGNSILAGAHIWYFLPCNGQHIFSITQTDWEFWKIFAFFCVFRAKVILLKI